MAFDGFFTRKMINELNKELEFGRINKINNISTTDFILSIRKNSNKKLLISINPQSSRIHITTHNYENPKTPSNFCTVLRKYLSNGFISSFEQINNDRIVKINIKNRDDLGYEKNYQLILELMGRHSNIILTDDKQTIIEAIKNSYDIEYSRHTIAGTEYKLPPTKEKYNPFVKLVDNYDSRDKKFYLNNYYGVSTLLNEYFCNYSNIEFNNFINNFDKYNCSTLLEDTKRDFYFFDIFQKNNKTKTFDNLSSLLDYFYLDSFQNDNNKNSNKHLYAFLKTKIARLTKKITILEEEISKAKQNNDNQLKGELLLANNYLFKHNVPTEVKLQNYYSENWDDIYIKLDENITIEQNAENYFNKHKKNKRTVENLTEQISITKKEIVYFETIETQLENAEVSDIDEILEELASFGYYKQKINKKNKRAKFTIINIDGTAIYIGKNNIQNDSITNKLAKRNYYWFHAKDVPGSHVVIFSDNPTKKQIEIANNLAAYYSKLKNENTVAVDNTLVKHVKKIPGAKPGMVTYTNQTTTKVKIDRELLKEFL